MVLLLAATPLGGGLDAAAGSTGPAVSSWITTPDQTQLFSTGPAPTFADAPLPGGSMITVDSGQTFQTMDGFGAAITDSSAHLLAGLPAAQRTEVMTALFSPTGGIGMSFLRQPIGSSDFVAGPHYTFDDLPAGQTDYPMARFSTDHDQAQILPLLRQAIALNPALKVMASPWSPPAWMKTGGSLVGGRLIDDPAIYRAYALYLLRFVQSYEQAGVPIYALTVQNEPQNRTPDGYPGTDMPVAAQAAVINQLGPLLRDAGLSRVKIISYDHNWIEHPDDLADAARLGVPAEPNYPYDVLRTSAAQWIAGTGYHCYAGDPTAQSALHNAFPQKDIWFTECSGWHGINDQQPQYFADTLKWHAANITIGATQNWAKAVATWNIALKPTGGPVNGGCGNNPQGMCTGVLTIDGTTVTRNAEYYTLGHMSRFVRQGATRIGSNNAGDIHSVAFRNPDGTIALVVTNVGGGTQTFGVSFNNQAISYTLPAGALATLTWEGSGKPVADTTPPTAPTALIASATTPTSTTLSWQASTDNVGVTGYTIHRDGTTIATSAGTTTTTITNLSPATTYRFTVTANDKAGNTSPDSGPATLTTPATAPAGPDPASWYQVINTNSGKCLDAADWGTGNGTALQQWSCNTPPTDNQLWQFQPTTNGYYRVINRHAPNKSWDVTGGPAATSNGTPIQLWDYVGGANQQWKAVSTGSGTYTFNPRNSGQCLDVRDVSTADGARLQQWACTGGPAQSFRLVQIP